MKAIGFGFVGLALGAIVGWLNRPTYIGGLIRSTPEDMAQGGAVLQDALGVIIPYAVGGFLLFALVGKVLVGKPKDDGRK